MHICRNMHVYYLTNVLCAVFPLVHEQHQCLTLLNYKHVQAFHKINELQNSCVLLVTSPLLHAHLTL